MQAAFLSRTGRERARGRGDAEPPDESGLGQADAPPERRARDAWASGAPCVVPHPTGGPCAEDCTVPALGASQPPVPGQASSGTRVSTRPGHGPSVTRYGLRTAPNSVLMSLIKKQTQNPVTFTRLLTGEGRFWSRAVFSGIRFLSCLGSFAGSLSHLGGGFSLLRRPPSSSVLRGRDEQCSNPPGCNL